MRHPQYEASAADARALFDEATEIRVAGTDADGAPILRTVHGVVVDGCLAFHGSPKGEKTLLVGRPVVASAEVVVARIPSYFLDPERACPATTYYRSAQVAGPLVALADAALKARVLEALMRKLQPQGGYVPITAEHPLYANAVRGIAVVGIALESAVAKFKLGQNRRPEELIAVLEALWRRGEPGDAEAVERVRVANRDRLTRLPEFLVGPPGIRLRPALGAPDLARTVELLTGQYWLGHLEPERIGRAQLGSTAWVGAEDEATGRLVGSARAMSDGARLAWIYDVVVDAEYRRRGIGRALTRLLLDHPRLRDVPTIRLGTRDAMPVYAGLGFQVTPLATGSAATTLMVLERGPTHGPTGK